MSKKTRTLTLSALLVALSIISLYIASVWPTGRFGLVAFSSLFVAAAVIEDGFAPGIYVYIISSILGMLIVPNRAAPLLYILFFGYYPIIKSLIERRGHIILQWVLKLLVFNVALTVLWLLLREIVFDFGEVLLAPTVLYLAGNVVFALFDYGYSKVIWFYIGRVSMFRRK